MLNKRAYIPGCNNEYNTYGKAHFPGFEIFIIINTIAYSPGFDNKYNVLIIDIRAYSPSFNNKYNIPMMVIDDNY